MLTINDRPVLKLKTLFQKMAPINGAFDSNFNSKTAAGTVPVVTRDISYSLQVAIKF
jgi:hypothetical protein